MNMTLMITEGIRPDIAIFYEHEHDDTSMFKRKIFGTYIATSQPAPVTNTVCLVLKEVHRSKPFVGMFGLSLVIVLAITVDRSLVKGASMLGNRIVYFLFGCHLTNLLNVRLL